MSRQGRPKSEYRSAQREGTPMTAPPLRSAGFTLVELLIALVLMAGMASILFGSLSLAARSWDGGEAKVLQVSDMRSAQTYLRAQIAAQYPQRLWKAAELPLLFAGDRLIAVADLGVTAEFAARSAEPSWRIAWNERGAVTEADVLSSQWPAHPPIR